MAKAAASTNKRASQIFSLLSSSLFILGDLEPRMRTDDFIIGYVLGAIWACEEAFGIADQMEKGVLVMQVFERIFPDSGLMFLEYTNRKVKNKDAEFMSRVQLGFRETLDSLNSGGQKILESLLNHAVRNYGP